MRKRILSFIVALLLLLPCMSAQAERVESLIDNALYRIVLRTAKGDVRLGGGVLQKGEYRVRYAIGGYVAGEYGFRLE